MRGRDDEVRGKVRPAKVRSKKQSIKATKQQRGILIEKKCSEGRQGCYSCDSLTRRNRLGQTDRHRSGEAKIALRSAIMESGEEGEGEPNSIYEKKKE